MVEGTYPLRHPCAPHIKLTIVPQENNNVTVFREKIKDYLAAQGMIKGHAGSAARNGDQQDILVLVADAHDPHHHSHSHTRSGPPSPSASSRSMSASSDDHDHRTSYGQMNTSNIRDRSGSAQYPALSLPPSHHGYGGASGVYKFGWSFVVWFISFCAPFYPHACPRFPAIFPLL